MSKKTRQTDLAYFQAQDAATYKSTRKKRLAEKRAYWLKNKKILKVKFKNYRNTERGKLVFRLNNMKRRLLIRTVSDGTVTASAVLEIFHKQSCKCKHCNTLLDFNKKRSVHIDHMLPIVKGGKHTITNIQILCSTCNLQKRDKTDEEFILLKQST